MDEPGCRDVAALAAEVALGVADARERGAVLSHVEHCAGCRRELGQLSDVADGLVDLAPPAEPPAGFESRVLEALPADRPLGSGDRGPADTTSTGRRPARVAGRRRLLQAAAVVVAAGLAAGGWALGARSTGRAAGGSGTGSASVPGGARPSGHVMTAALVAGQRSVGEVVLQTGRYPWISMALEASPNGPEAGTVTCRVRTRAGRLVVLGSFTFAGGYGYWAAPVPTASPVEAAQLVDRDGRVIASATLVGAALSRR